MVTEKTLVKLSGSQSKMNIIKVRKRFVVRKVELVGVTGRC